MTTTTVAITTLQSKLDKNEKENAKIKAIIRRFPSAKIINSLFVAPEIDNDSKAKFQTEVRMIGGSNKFILFREIQISFGGNKCSVRSQKNIPLEYGTVIEILNAPSAAKALFEAKWNGGRALNHLPKDE